MKWIQVLVVEWHKSIGEKIYKVSTGSQVLCISHLPQVAAMADAHLYIAKINKGGRTKTSVTPLTKRKKLRKSDE